MKEYRIFLSGNLNNNYSTLQIICHCDVCKFFTDSNNKNCKDYLFYEWCDLEVNEIKQILNILFNYNQAILNKNNEKIDYSEASKIKLKMNKKMRIKNYFKKDKFNVYSKNE